MWLGNKHLIFVYISEEMNIWLYPTLQNASSFIYLEQKIFIQLQYQNAQLKFFPTLKLRISFSCDRSWKNHIVSLNKQASKKLKIQRNLQYFLSKSQLYALLWGTVRLYKKNLLHI